MFTFRSRHRWRGRVVPLAIATVVCSVLSVSGSAAEQDNGGWRDRSAWPMGGQNFDNSRFNPFEHTINKRNASRLTTKWVATTQGDVSATPAVVGDNIYFPDWGGFFSKLDARTGRTIWTKKVADYTGLTRTVARNSPVVSGNTVYIGDQDGHLIAVDTRTGNARWTLKLDPHPAVILTASPIVVDGVVYQGVSSVEEGFASDPNYPCCTFRGSIVAVDARTGRLLWQTYMVPDNGGQPGGYSGGAIWSSTPAVDRWHRTMYVTTGNNYDVPQSVKDCQTAGRPASECISPDNHIDSFVALDMRTGRIKWATGTQGFDHWNGACVPGEAPNNCPDNPGEDFDFGDGAHLFTARGPHGRTRDMVGAGQKSGQYWALDARTGEIVWSVAPAPGSSLGGIQWGTATDGERIYLAEANFFRLPYKLPNGETTTAGSFAALDPATGRILWQTPDPQDGRDIGAVSVANGVMYAGSMTGHMYALDAATGRILFTHKGEGSSAAGPAIVDGTVYWGNGYFRFGLGTGSTKFYAFSLPRRDHR